MPRLTAQQYLQLGNDWQAYHGSLVAYQATRALDPEFDDPTMQIWQQSAASMVALCGQSAMRAAFNDAADACKKLQNVTKEATLFANMLAQTAGTWNRLAKAANALVTLVTDAGASLNPITLLTDADGVAKAYTGDPTATATASAPTS